MATKSIELRQSRFPSGPCEPAEAEHFPNEPAPPRLQQKSRARNDDVAVVMGESSSSCVSTAEETSEPMREQDSAEQVSAEHNAAEPVTCRAGCTAPVFKLYGYATAATSVTITAFTMPAIMWLTPDTVTSHTLLILAALGAGATVGAAGSLVHYLTTGFQPAFARGKQGDNQPVNNERIASMA